MDKLNIAIADDNAKVLQLLDKIVSSCLLYTSDAADD